MTESPKFKLGDHVDFTGHYLWCGRDTHGDKGVITHVHVYPEGIVEGDAIYEVQRLIGDGVPCNTPVPMTAPDLTLMERLG